MIFLKKYWKPIVFTVVGITAGFAYWRFVGCKSGTCPITSNWHTSVLMGGLLGFIIGIPGKDNKSEKTS
jgi:Family of unknown function (DUF6132)